MNNIFKTKKVESIANLIDNSNTSDSIAGSSQKDDEDRIQDVHQNFDYESETDLLNWLIYNI